MERLVSFETAGRPPWRGRVVSACVDDGLLLVESLEGVGETVWLHQDDVAAEMPSSATTTQSVSPSSVTESIPAPSSHAMKKKSNSIPQTSAVSPSSTPATGETSGPCNVCKSLSETRCSRCASVFYCSKEHQKEDWKHHKGMCFHVASLKSSPASAMKGLMLEGQGSEMLGTFRWGPDHMFQLLPSMPAELQPAYRVVRGWQQYLAIRYVILDPHKSGCETRNE